MRMSHAERLLLIRLSVLMAVYSLLMWLMSWSEPEPTALQESLTTLVYGLMCLVAGYFIGRSYAE